MSAAARSFVYTFFISILLSLFLYLLVRAAVIPLTGDQLIIAILIIFSLCISFFVYLFTKVNITKRLEEIAAYLTKIEEEIELLPELIEEQKIQEVKKVLISVNMLIKQLKERLQVKLEEVQYEKIKMQNMIVDFVDGLERAVHGDYTVRMAVTPDLVGALAEILNELLSNIEREFAEIYRLATEYEGSDREGILEEIKRRLSRLKFKVK